MIIVALGRGARGQLQVRILKIEWSDYINTYTLRMYDTLKLILKILVCLYDNNTTTKKYDSLDTILIAKQIYTDTERIFFFCCFCFLFTISMYLFHDIIFCNLTIHIIYKHYYIFIILTADWRYIFPNRFFSLFMPQPFISINVCIDKLFFFLSIPISNRVVFRIMAV